MVLDDDLEPSHWKPSPNDVMLNYQEAVENEDRIRCAAWARGATNDATVQAALKGPQKPISREELLKFAQTMDWKSTLSDPSAKAAMKRVQNRISSLKKEGMQVVMNATVEPNVGQRLLNQRVRVPIQHEFFMSSTFNPLEASHPTRGWDQRVRPWPGRKISDSKGEETSYWVAGWAGSDKGLDTNFQIVRPQDITPYAREAKKMHGRAFR